MKKYLLVAVLVIAAVFAGWFYVHRSASEPTSRNGDTAVSVVSIKFIDQQTGKPIVNTKFSLWSDNGVRCIKAPCPTNGHHYEGKTDGKGMATLAVGLIQEQTTITPAGYKPAEPKLFKNNYIARFEKE